MERVSKPINIKKILLEVLFFVFFGGLIVLFFAQHSEVVQQYCADQLILLLEKEWNACIQCRHIRFNFFSLFIECDNAVIKGKGQGNFSWEFEQGSVTISLLNLLFQKKIVLDIYLDHISARSLFYEGECPLMNHIKDIAEDKNLSFSVVLNNILLDHIKLDFYDENDHAKNSFFFDGTVQIKRSDSNNGVFSYIKGSKLLIGFGNSQPELVQLSDINVTLNSLLESKKLKASASCHASLNGMSLKLPVRMNIDDEDLSFYMGIDQKKCGGYLKGTLNGKSAFHFSFPLSELSRAAPFISTVDFNSERFKDMAFILDGSLICNDTKRRVNSSVRLDQGKDSLLTGDFKYDGERFKGMIQNRNLISLWPTRSIKTGYHEWKIEPKKFLLRMSYNEKLGFVSNGACYISDQVTNQRHKVLATLAIKDASTQISASMDNSLFANIDVNLSPFPYCTRLKIYNESEDLCALSGINDQYKTLSGEIEYGLLKYFDDEIDRYCTGHNVKFVTNIRQLDGYLKGYLALKSGNFYLPENRTLIKQCSTYFSIDTALRLVTLRKTHLGFGKGQVNIPYAIASFSSCGEMSFLHLPLEVKDLFVNWKQHAYGLIYGHFSLMKMENNPYKYQGFLVSRRALLKEKALRYKSSPSLWPLQEMNDSIFFAQGACAFITENPISITTPNFKATINCNVHIHRNSSLSPYIVGLVTLDEGTINLFRSKLLIERGHMQFFTNAIQDPMIDFVAKSRIHKYIITLNLAGSLNNPTVHLESTPSLSEEQIISLLLSGSDQTSLQSDLPAMLLYNLNDIILGNRKFQQKASTLFNRLTRPLRYIQITPDFTNQSGRGGIKGIVSVDVNENFSAQIQKNFNLQEDFSFYLQYLLSDDVSLKVIKDQRGDIGSEVEVRLKL